MFNNVNTLKGITMARKQKSDLNVIDICIPKLRQFTDRKEPLKVFNDALEMIDSRNYSILAYYGIGGIGKSRFQKYIKEDILDSNSNVIYSWVDFELETNRKPYKAYRILANNFKGNVDFHTFNLAYFIYLSKAFPEYDFKKKKLPFLEEGSLVASGIDLLENVSGVRLAIGVIDYVVGKSKKYTFNKNITNRLKKLNYLEETEIEKELILFFAYDIDRFKENNPQKKVVIFLDTYEALWENKKEESYRLTLDEWIRDALVTELQKVLFVICGREKLRWDEVEKEWKEDIEQHLLGNLSGEDTISFLKSCKILDKNIQQQIVKSSEGVPYYLDICVDIYYQIQNPTVNDFKDVKKEDIFKRFMKYLNQSESESLKILSNTRFYTKDIFEDLITKFKTSYPITAMYSLNEFSFILKSNEKFFIHKLMRNNLIAMQSKELKQEVNKFMFEYYDKKLNNLVSKSISEEHMELFKEAFYHKSKLNDVEELISWYKNLYDIFYQKAKYDDLLEVTLLLKEITLEKLGNKHPTTAISYNNLAELYHAKGKYENALTNYKIVLEIIKFYLGDDHLEISITYNNLGGLYLSMGEYSNAISLFEVALKIRKKTSGNNHLNTGVCYNNLARSYHMNGEYTRAIFFYKKALKISKKTLGNKHIDIAIYYNNLAEIYKTMGEYAKTLPLYELALQITKEILGDNHLNTIKFYHNLAESLQLMGEPDKALSIFKLTLKKMKKILGDMHPDTATAYNDLGRLYQVLGQYDKVLPFFKLALKIRKEILGDKHPDIATSYNDLAVFYDLIEKYDKALPYYKSALGIYIESLGDKHLYTAINYENQAKLYYKINDFKKSYEFIKKAIEIYIEVLSKEHPTLINAKLNLEIIEVEI